ncbi:hypothetical protein EDB81DRAFT_908529 [Dactylonectria macrodidyma]|uniref:Uncharacterized protein n=1 Tax=Dactylonectria macrodidyma TaxID=307937 RepID=A0A9P9FMK1_9HYPO|nr:hypothetical protein EDB81DRAFT_908529 [Dactylonectria macrodidyma]
MAGRRQSSWRSLSAYCFIAATSLLLLLFGGPSGNPGLNSHLPVTQRDLYDNVVANLTERATTTYEEARVKGAKLHCLMAMSQEDSRAANKGASLEAPIYLQTDQLQEMEGWRYDPERKPFFQNYLDAALSGLGISGEAHYIYWVHTDSGQIYDDPTFLFDDEAEGNFDVSDGEPSAAYFGNAFILDPGVVIADTNLGVIEAMKRKSIPDTTATTHIRQWSDAAWMQWFVFQALINKNAKDGKGTTIGKWSDKITLTADDNPDEFFAVLGTPNGSGSAFFLLNHKGKLGVKTINKVDIFVPVVPFTVIGTTVTGFEKSRKITLLFHVTDA